METPILEDVIELTPEEVQAIAPGDVLNLGNGIIVTVTETAIDEGLVKQFKNGEWSPVTYDYIKGIKQDGSPFRFVREVFRHSTRDVQNDVRKCVYCGTLHFPPFIVQKTIISPNWASQGYKSPLRDYCKDKPCASYDQMAHEG